LLILLGFYGTRRHLRNWTEAAAMRDTVRAAAAGSAEMHRCPEILVSGLPDTLRGAYLFRNGAREVLAEAGVNAFAVDRPGPCAFSWNPSPAAFEPRGAGR